MQLHNLKSKTKFRKGQRIGRGGKRGTTSGRGTKGQKARAGHKIRPAIRDIIKKIPKRRGYKFNPFRKNKTAVSFQTLEKKFKAGETVSPDILVKKGVVSRISGRVPKIKIIGATKESKNKFVFKDVEFSRSAKSAAR